MISTVLGVGCGDLRELLLHLDDEVGIDAIGG